MKRNLLFLCSALTLLAGCSQNDVTNETIGAGDEIRATARALSMSAETQAGTRTAYTATHAKGMQALVLSTQTKDDYTTQYAKGSMTFDGTDAENTSVQYSTTDFTGNSKLPADKSSLYLCALYPYSNTAWSSVGTTASYTFDGRQDVMAAPQKEIAKGGTGDGSAAAAGTASFAFKHLLTKIDIKVKADLTEAIAAWGVVKSITVSKVLGPGFKNVAVVTLADGTAETTSSTAFTGTESSWKTYTAFSGSTPDTEFVNQSQALTTTATDAATTMMAPFTATNAASDLELTVVTKTTTGSDYTSKIGVKIPAGDTQGNAYTVTLNFKVTAITGTATVGGWTVKDAGETEVN
ncbi:hypothetical protein [Bacteroides sp.]